MSRLTIKERRELVWNKYSGCCAYCGQYLHSTQLMQVDHLIPRSRFLSIVKAKYKLPPIVQHLTEHDVHHIDNLMPSCRVCNNWKKDFDLEFFRNEIAEQLKRLNDYSSNFRMAKRFGLVVENKIEIVFYFERIINKK